jgi:hypothetical protein
VSYKKGPRRVKPLTTKQIITFRGYQTNAALNTPENKALSVSGGHAQTSRAFLLNIFLDIAGTGLDANGAYCEASLKAGSQSSTTPTCDQAGSIPGATAQALRLAQYDVKGDHPVFAQYPPGSVEIPIIDGGAAMTLSVGASGFTATKPTVYYSGQVLFVDP